MTYFVPEVAEHRPVGLPEIHAQPLAVGILCLRDVDGDDTVRVPDRDGSAERLTRQQVECQPALAAPERFDGQPEVDELVDEHPQIRQRRR